MDEYTRKLENLLVENYSHLKKKGYTGYDPQLFWHLIGYKLYAEKQTTLRRIIRRLEAEVLKKIPTLILPYAKFCNVEKELSPYGLGLFLQATLKMHTIFREEKYLAEAEHIVELLIPLLIPLPHGLGAGNPKTKYNEYKPFFKTFATNETSYLVVVSEILFGLIALYKLRKKEKYFQLIKELSESIPKDYTIKKCSGNSVMLNYSTAKDDCHILNANALAMASLVVFNDNQSNFSLAEKVYTYISRYIYMEKIPYAGSEDKNINASCLSADLYHSGFTLRGMLTLAKRLNKKNDIKKIETRIIKVLNDYLLDNDIVLFQNVSEIEIHALAEYLNLFSVVYYTINDNDRKKYLKIISLNINKMNNKKGSYFYKKRRSSSIDIYFPRWSHAAMMNAISNLIIAIQRNKDGS